ncbi:MAG: FtsX-like permease family protein [Hespellia sp.]|nr:FtsX-like permease family protein [Hespellia sp.]
MIWNLIRNDIKQNKLLSAATIFFLFVSAMLLTLTALLLSNLLGAIDDLMHRAEVPEYLQMHAGAIERSEVARFVENHEEVLEWQISGFLNLDNSQITLGSCNLADSTQDNGLCVQGERFDYLLDMENQLPEVFPGEVFVPICYRTLYHLSVGDRMKIGNQSLTIAGFVRDAQMNSMMASSKRFLVSAHDYERFRDQGEEEYLIEFRLRDGTDKNVFGTAYAAAGLPANGPAITAPLIRQMSALSDGTVIFVLFLVSIVALLISILCIYFILSLQMERDRKEVGMLKAFGVGNVEIRRIYFAKYLLFSVCGAFSGLFVALLLKIPLEKQLQELYGTADKGIENVVLLCFVLLLTEGIILYSIRCFLKKTDRLSALEALFSAQEQKTGKRRYLPIGFVVSACTFLLVIPQNLYSTMSDPAFVTYMGIGDGKIRMDVRQMDNIEEKTEQIRLSLKADTRVEKYAVFQTISVPVCLSDGKTVNLSLETGDHSVFPVECSQGTLPKNSAEIALSTMNAKELGVSVGDPIKLMIAGRETVYTVCGIYSDITNGGKTAKACYIDKEMPIVWSVLYVTLKESADKVLWMEQYRQLGADVTDVADYVKNTYGQTLDQLRLVSEVAFGVAVLIVSVVIVLFLRLIVEKDRNVISLYKALGFTSAELKKTYFAKGLLSVIVGIGAGLFLGNLFGENLCGMILKSFGADSFQFVIAWKQILVMIPSVILVTTIVAVWAGIAEIRRMKACECCMGKE